MLKNIFQKIKSLFEGKIENFEPKEQVEPIATPLPVQEKRTYFDYDWTSVIEFETGGKEYYEKKLKNLSWPRGQSGITMGIGADLGYMTHKEFEQYFSKYFTKEENKRIKEIIGLKGELAKLALSKVRDIQLSWNDASKAFVEWTLPKFWEMTLQLWPEFDKLHEKAQIALVSIVFNRGASTRGPSRIEMKNIKDLV
jgi:hypothetical protein